jgi:hypothetical protein
VKTKQNAENFLENILKGRLLLENNVKKEKNVY